MSCKTNRDHIIVVRQSFEEEPQFEEYLLELNVSPPYVEWNEKRNDETMLIIQLFLQVQQTVDRC
jgi:hypothetical protein